LEDLDVEGSDIYINGCSRNRMRIVDRIDLAQGREKFCDLFDKAIGSHRMRAMLD